MAADDPYHHHTRLVFFQHDAGEKVILITYALKN